MANTPADDETLTNYVKQLEAENAVLVEQKQALVEEFRQVLPEEFSAADLRKQLREKILPEAVSQYIFLLNNSESDAVRAGLIKFAFQYVKESGSGSSDEGNDKLAELLADLASADL